MVVYELLNFIHSEVGKINYSNEQIISLIKEHKKVSFNLNKEYDIKKFQSDINLQQEDLQKFDVLKRIIKECWGDSDTWDSLRKLTARGCPTCYFL